MAFDAGSIEASLTLRSDQFNKDMDAAEARVDKFEKNRHEVKIAAVFDQSSLSKARQQFAQLDQQISKDAMSRLRSNPQGSVLGALNALFSPHPVTGAPSPTQAAQQGLLGKIIQSPGGGGTTGPQSGQNTVSQVLGSSTGSGQSNANNITTTDRVNTVGLPTDNSITTTDRVNTVGLPSSGGSITTTDKIEPDVDTASLKAKASQAGKDAADAADDALTKESRAKGSGWFSGFLSGIGSMVGKALGDLGGGGGGSGGNSKNAGGGGSFGGNLVNAIGPGILGTSFKGASIAGLLGAGVASLPALTAGLAPLGVAGAGAGVVALGAKQLIGTANRKGKPATEGPLYAQAQQAGQALQDMVQKAATGLIGPLKSLFGQIPALAKQVTPALTQVFSGAVALIQPAVNGLVAVIKQVGPLLGEAFKATGPLLEPLIKGIGSLVSGLMPGLIAMLKAAGPAVQVVSGFFGTLGANLGQMFRDFSTVIGPSSVILKALLDVVAGLLPVIGSLAQVLASALGPAFTAFAGAIRALEPFLVTVGKIFAQFAGAVLQDLAAGLQLVAGVLKAVSPALNQLATVLGQVFNTLESKGAFAQLGNILESLATPLGNLISKLVSGLAPAIPPLLNLFGQFVNVISSVGVQVLTALIPPITQLAETALGALVKVLPLVIPVVTQLLTAFTADAGNLISQIGGSLLNLANVVLTALLKAAQPLIPVVLGLVQAFIPLLNLFTTAVAASVAAVANALAAVVNAIPTPVLTAMLAGVLAVVGGMKLWASASTAVATGIKAITGSSIVSWVSSAVGSIATFAAATEGATLAEKAMLAAELAFDAVSPFVWVGAAVALLGGLTAALVLTNAQSQTVVGGFAQQEQQIGYNISGYQKLADTISNASAGYEKFARSSTDAVRGGAAGAQTLSTQLSAQAQAVLQTAQNMESRVTSLSQNLGVSKTVIEQWASAAGISAEKFGSAGENVGQLTTQIAAYVNKNAEAITSTSSVATNIAIFGSDVLSANTQLDAFNSIWNTLVGNLLTKQQAVTQSKTAFDSLKQSISDTGKASDQTGSSWQAYMSQIQSSATALEKSGASVSQVNSYMQTQISNLESLGPLNKSQQADVNALKAFNDALANSTHGLNAEQQSLITQFQTGLIPSLQQMHADTPAVNTDIKNLADSIIQTGNNSSATKGDRAQLIKDLENAGLTSQQATQFVDGLQKKIDALKGKVVSVGVNVSAAGKAAATALVQGEATLHDSITFQTQGAAMGGLITGGTPGKDSVLGLLMPGEVVVPTKMVQAGAVDHLRGMLPGFASGGMIDLAAPVNQAAAADQQWSQASALQWAAASVKAFQTAAAAAATAAANAFVATQGASGGIIQSLMKNMAAAKGWTGAEWNALADVEQREAGWSITATNPTSGAYGLAQFISGPSEYAQYGGDSTTAQGQITGMLNYIASRYGDPINAWNHELCVPLDVEILTRRGWLNYDQLRAGDETIGYNFETGHSEWTPVNAVHVYEDAPLVRLTNKSWEAVCTPNHRWVSRKHEQAPRDNRDGGPKSTSTVVEGFVEAAKITTRHGLRLAAEADLGSGPEISDKEAELLGWVMGDGSVAHLKSKKGADPKNPRTGTGSRVSIRLYQSKPDHVKAIDALVNGLMFNRMTRPMEKPDGQPGLPLTTWEFSRGYSAELLKRSGYDHRDPVPFVVSLSASQRAAFLHGVFAAEGSYAGGTGFAEDRSKVRWTKVYYQNDGAQQDAIVVAIYLSGKRPGIGEMDNRGLRIGRWTVSTVGAVIRETKPFLGGERIVREDAGRGPVWCVSTSLGSWTMRQGRQVMLTGNSYGWYDRGGSLKPGYTLAYNGTGRPEQVVPNNGASFDDVVARLDKLIRATEQVPAGVGAHVGGAINGSAHDASFRSRYPRGGSLWAGTLS